MPISRLFLYYKEKTDGSHAVYLYVPMDVGPPAKISTGKSCLKDHWDPERQRILGSGPQVKRENLILSGMISLADMIIRDFELRGKTLSRNIFKQEFSQPGSREDFIEYYEKEVEGDFLQGLFGPSTLAMKRRTAKKMKAFWPDGLRFADITKELIIDFDRWHAREMKKKDVDGTRERIKSLKYLKQYMQRAKESRQFQYPFTNYKFPTGKNGITYLSEIEVKKMLQFFRDPDLVFERMLQLARERGMMQWNVEQYASPSGVQRIKKVMRLFLWQCFTGCRYGDSQKFTRKNIQDGFLIWMPQKTSETSGKVVKMKITPIIHSLMIPGEARLIPRISNVNYNKYLKEVGAILQLDKTLTSHVGRHTFATLFLSRGGSVVALKELMGLTKLKTVMVYFHAADSFLESEMEKVFSDF